MKKNILLTTIILLIVLFTVGSGVYIANQRGNATNPSAPKINRIPEMTGTVGALIVGVDCSQELTDVIMYVQFNAKQKTARVLSIPRDTFIGDEYPTGKINAVYKTTHSMEALVKEVRESFCLPVDYYAKITLESLGALIDDIGGVTINIPMDIYDLGVLHFSAGEQTLNGEQAQIFVRLRNAYANADLGRIEAQHNFMLSLMHKLQLLGKIKLAELIMQNFSMVETDMPLDKVLSAAVTASTISEENIEMFTIPGIGKYNYSYAVYEVDKPALSAILNEHFLAEPIDPESLRFPLVQAPQEEPVAYQESSASEEPASSDEAEKPSKPEEEESSSSRRSHKVVRPSSSDSEENSDSSYEDEDEP